MAYGLYAYMPILIYTNILLFVHKIPKIDIKTSPFYNIILF